MTIPTYAQIVAFDTRLRNRVIQRLDKEVLIPECTTFRSVILLWSGILGLSGTYLLWRAGTQKGFWIAIVMTTLSGALLHQVIPLGSNPREPL